MPDHARHLPTRGNGLPAPVARRVRVVAVPARRKRAAVVLVGLYDSAAAPGESAHDVLVPPALRPVRAAAHRGHRAALEPVQARHAVVERSVAVHAGVGGRLALEVGAPVVLVGTVCVLAVGECPMVAAGPREDVRLLGGEVGDQRGERLVRGMAGEIRMHPGVEMLPAP